MNTLKKLIAISLFLWISNSLFAQNNENDIAGNWYCEEADKTTMKIFKNTDGFWYSTILTSDDKKGIGKNALKKMEYNPIEKQYKGDLYVAGKNLNLSATVSLQPDGKLKIVGKKVIISKTLYWNKVK
jgi:uncharacterized protein (DUF2147 family)